jgi:hypothetical protein
MTESRTGARPRDGPTAGPPGASPDYQQALDTAGRLLGEPLTLPLGPGEPASGADFRRLATEHTFGDSWSRGGLDDRSRALVSVTIAATLGTREPLRGQLRLSSPARGSVGAAGRPAEAARPARRAEPARRHAERVALDGVEWRFSRLGSVTERVTCCLAWYDPNVFPALTLFVLAALGPM